MAKFQPPRGTRDFLPEEMIGRQYVIDVIRKTFEKWGFDPLQTPAFEEWKLLAAKGGEAIKNEIYYFRDKSNRELGLRFDVTVPTARVVASNPNLPKPFRRYQIAPVWRYDRPGAGRYREFWQADIDVFGASAGAADALCVAVACDAMKQLGFEDFFIRVNNRKIVEAFLLSIGLRDKILDVLRSIDKLEKIGEREVAAELKGKKIDTDKIKKIIEFIKIKNLNDVKKAVLKEQFGKQGVDELESIFNYIEAFGFSNYVKFDISLVRGLEYYTGPVFEINAGINVSVGGGGRYDNLVEGFGGKATPATGISLGVDRVVTAMNEKKILKTEKTSVKVYIASVSTELMKNAAEITKKLIDLGISVEFDLMDRSLSKQLAYVDAKGVPFAMIIGEKEVEKSAAKLRDMKTGKEYDIHLGNLEEVLKYVK